MDWPNSICAGEAIGLMTAVVEEAGPDTRYDLRPTYDDHGNPTFCVLYVCGGEADCMFGRMLERFGVPCHRLSGSQHLPIGWMLARLQIVCPPGLAHNLRMAQVLHDLSVPWGYVLNKFQDDCMAAAAAGVRM